MYVCVILLSWARELARYLLSTSLLLFYYCVLPLFPWLLHFLLVSDVLCLYVFICSAFFYERACTILWILHNNNKKKTNDINNYNDNNNNDNNNDSRAHRGDPHDVRPEDGRLLARSRDELARDLTWQPSQILYIIYHHYDYY